MFTHYKQTDRDKGRYHAIILKNTQILKGNVLIGYLLYINYCITFFHKLGENGLVDCFEILSDILHNLQSSTSHINLVTFCHLKTKIPSQILCKTTKLLFLIL